MQPRLFDVPASVVVPLDSKRTYPKGSPEWQRVYSDALAAVKFARYCSFVWLVASSEIKADARAGRNPNVQATFKQLRKYDVLDPDGKPVAFSNDLIPAFARMIEADLRDDGENDAANVVRAHMTASYFDSEGMPWQM